MAQTTATDHDAALTRLKHLRHGWLLLGGFAVMGLMLELMHGFKLSWYLDVHNETRHTMLRLGHAHGTFLGLVNIAFAATVERTVGRSQAWNQTSRLLSLSSILLPGGFILGGVFTYDGDPGLGIALVPIGAICLITAAFKISQNLRHAAT